MFSGQLREYFSIIIIVAGDVSGQWLDYIPYIRCLKCWAIHAYVSSLKGWTVVSGQWLEYRDREQSE